MPPTTVTALASALLNAAAERAGALYGAILVRLPYALLLHLERLRVPIASWALLRHAVARASVPSVPPLPRGAWARALARDAWRTGLTAGLAATAAALVSLLALAASAGARFWLVLFTGSAAWMSGVALRGALDVFRTRRALTRQCEHAHFYRAQLDALELELASDEPDVRAAAERRLLALDPFAQIGLLTAKAQRACSECGLSGGVHYGWCRSGRWPAAHGIMPLLLALALGACAGDAAPAPSCSTPAAELDPILTLPYEDCAGTYVYANTLFSAHPDTDVCTFACDDSARLAHFCAALGGACTRASDGLAYCSEVSR